MNASYNILGAGGVPTALSEISGHPEDKWGGAVMAALQIKNLPTGAGDDIKIDASYAKGDTKAVISTSGASPSFAMFGSTGSRALTRALALAKRLMRSTCPGSYRRCYRRPQAGGCMGYPWCVQPQLGSLLVDQPLGQLRSVRYNGGALDILSAKGQFCASFNAGKAVSADYSCNPDYNIAQVGVVTRWTPVKNLTFSAEVGAFFLDQKFTGAAALAAAAPKPTTVYEFKDQSTVFLNVRAQRNF